jgi:hypothetical protein
MLVDMVVEVHQCQTTLVVAVVVLVQQEPHIKPQEQLVVDLVEMVFQFRLIALLHIFMLVVVVEWVPQKPHMKQVMVDKVALAEAVVDLVEEEQQVQMEELLVKQALLVTVQQDQQDIALVQVVVVEHTLKELVVMVVLVS